MCVEFNVSAITLDYVYLCAWEMCFYWNPLQVYLWIENADSLLSYCDSHICVCVFSTCLFSTVSGIVK